MNSIDRLALIELEGIAIYLARINRDLTGDAYPGGELQGFPDPEDYNVDPNGLEQWLAELRVMMERQGFTLAQVHEKVRKVYRDAR